MRSGDNNLLWGIGAVGEENSAIGQRDHAKATTGKIVASGASGVKKIYALARG